MPDDDMIRLVLEHGAPEWVQTGVVHDEDGWQAVARWHFPDGTTFQQYLTPSVDEAAAERAAREWSEAIRSAFKDDRVMVDTTLMRGDGWVRCCICAELHVAPYERLAVDSEGERWDVCAGQCAVEAGIE